MWYSWRINALLSQPVSQTFHEWLKWWTQSESKASGQNKGLNVGEILLPENRDVAAGACPSDPRGFRKQSWPQTKSLLQLAYTISRACKTGQELKSGILRFDKPCMGLSVSSEQYGFGLGPCTGSTKHCQATQLLQCFETPCFHQQLS